MPQTKKPLQPDHNLQQKRRKVMVKVAGVISPDQSGRFRRTPSPLHMAYFTTITVHGACLVMYREVDPHTLSNISEWP